MKTIKIIIASLVYLCLTTSCYNEDPSIADLPVMTGKPYSIHSDGYAFFRIPSMVITKNGTILAFAEGRVNSVADQGDIDIVLKRSTDRGKTWSNIIKVKDDGKNRCRNQVPIYLPESNRILLVSCWDSEDVKGIQICVTHSDDEGLTWSAEKKITSSVMFDNDRWYATGPCHGIVKQFEPHKGRIIVPCNHHLKNQPQGRSHVIYSDDGGETWHIGGIVDKFNTNESSVTELSNGNLLLDMRNQDAKSQNNKRYRIHAISTDGGESWGPSYQSTLFDPICQGSILYAGTGDNGMGRILFSNPNSLTRRNNNTLQMSEDDGKTWTKSFSYTGSDFGGYSDISMFPEGTVGVLYEFGFKNIGGIAFQEVNLSQLK